MSALAKETMQIGIKFPWWYQARIITLVELAKAGFVIDMKAEAKAIVEAARFR